MTDGERLDFLDALMRQGKVQSGLPGGWYIREKPGQITIADEYACGTDIRAAIDRFKAHCDHVNEAMRRLADDEVRTSALEFEERQEAIRADNEARV